MYLKIYWLLAAPFSLNNGFGVRVLREDIVGSMAMNTDRMGEGVYFYEIRDNNEIQVGKEVKK